jgi:hypothetical protein
MSITLLVLGGIALAGVAGVWITSNIAGAAESNEAAAEAELEAGLADLELANFLAMNPEVMMPDTGYGSLPLWLAAGALGVGVLALVRG